ncbi:MAG: YraN family protein [Clostridia bacterium]|nr:YraN family protein [Clostridia bacterium]
MFNLKTWKDGEHITQRYMKKEGYKIVYTNFSVAGTELDVVAVYPKNLQIKKLKKELKEKLKVEDNRKKQEVLKKSYENIIKTTNDLLVITEVKARSTDEFGKGFDAMDLKKRAHLIRGAKALKQDKRFEGMQVRFDVASVDGGKLEYIENAI